MNDVYITGIEMIAFGRYPHRTPASLGAEAVLGALADAGITVHDIQTAYCGCVFQTMVGQKTFHQIGQTGIPIAHVSNARPAEHTSELQPIMSPSFAVFSKKKKTDRIIR